jgi:hypothetical protein
MKQKLFLIKYLPIFLITIQYKRLLVLLMLFMRKLIL